MFWQFHEGLRGHADRLAERHAALAEERDAIEEVLEPYLLQQGLIARTPRGRVLTGAAWTHLNMQPPKGFKSQLELLSGTDDV